MTAYVADMKKRKKPPVPSGYKNREEFLSEMRQRFDQALEADSENRIAALDDLKFIYGEQWDTGVLSRRKRQRKPSLVVNRLPAFVAQVVNNRLLNETEIRVYPEREGTKEVAEIRQGIIRSVFRSGEGDFARDEALKYQTICGQGAFELCVEYNNDEVFYQDAKLRAIANPFAAVFDPLAVLPCAGDARFAFVVDEMSIPMFRARYPWASVSGFGDGGLTTGTPTTTWYSGEVIKVVTYWRMIEDGTRTLALLVNGNTVDVPDDIALQELLAAPPVDEMGEVNLNAVARRPNGEPLVRTVPKIAAQKYLCSGGDILEGPYTLPVSSIPVYRVPGWELRTGERTYRWGLVRFLKDPQRLHNYFRSVIAEQLVAAPRNKWLATKEAVSGYEQAWRNSHLSDDPLLIWNGEGQRPERLSPPGIDSALINEAQTAAQDIKDVSNIHEAALGQKSNEVSGRAIQARQQMTDLGSFIYHDRLRLAEERCARNLNEIIPVVYDPQRTLTIFGEDNKALQVTINDPANPESDVTLGKYGLTVTTGPATITKRALAAEQMMAFVNAAPDTASFVMDLVAEAQDWPQASEFARRFRLALPPGVIPEEDMPEEMRNAANQQREQASAEAEMEAKKKEAEILLTRAEAVERMARARNLVMTGAKALSDAEARAKDVDSRAVDRRFQQQSKAIEDALKSQEEYYDDQF